MTTIAPRLLTQWQVDRFRQQSRGNNDDDLYLASADGTNVQPLFVDTTP